MKKTGIFYGSTNGDTESVANKIAIQLGIGKEDVHNVADTTPEKQNRRLVRMRRFGQF